MRLRLIQLLLGYMALLVGGCQPSVLSPTQFTAEYVAVLKKASSVVKEVRVIEDLHLDVEFEDGRRLTFLLHNAYTEYKTAPSNKVATIGRYVAGNLESLPFEDEAIDPAQIVPVVRDAAWLEEINSTVGGQEDKGPGGGLTEPLNDSLVVLYAENGPKTIRFLRMKTLKKAGVEKEGLRQLSVKNLMRLLPKIELAGSNGMYGVIADGNYEASLLLVDSFWTKDRFDVQGDFVVAIPNRNMLLVTGSENAAGIKKVRALAAKSCAESSYPLTPKLFVRRNDKWVEFND